MLETDFLNSRQTERFKYLAVAFTVIFMVLNFVDHFVIDSQLNQSTQRYELIRQNDRLSVEIQRALLKVQEMFTLNSGIYSSLHADAKAYFASLQEDLLQSQRQI